MTQVPTGRRELWRSPAARLTASSYVAPLVMFVASPLIARALGPSLRGSLATVLVWSEIGSMAFRFGIPDAAGYFDQQGFRRRDIWRTSQRVAILITPLALLVGVGVAFLVDPVSGRQVALLSAIFVAWSPLVETLASVRLRFVISSADFDGLARYNLVAPIFAILCTLVVVAIADLTLGAATLALVGGQVLSYIYIFYRSTLSLNELGPKPSTSTMVRYGSRTIPAAWSEALNSRVDQLIVPTLLGLEALGFYAVAVSFAGLVGRIGVSISQIEYSRVGSAGDQRFAVAARSVRRATALCLVVAIAISTAVPIAIPLLFGAEFWPAVLPCIVLVLASAFTAANLVASNIANVLGFPSISSVAQVAGLLVTVAFVVPAILVLGILGAAVVSLLSYVLRYLVTIRLLRRRGVASCVPRWNDAIAVLGVGKKSLAGSDLP